MIHLNNHVIKFVSNHTALITRRNWCCRIVYGWGISPGTRRQLKTWRNTSNYPLLRVANIACEWCLLVALVDLMFVHTWMLW